MKRLIQQSNHALGRVEDGCLLAIIAFMLIMSLLQIVLRNGFDSGLVWAETALRVSVLWAAMLGALRGSRHGGHIAIDIVQRYATGNVARTFQILTMLSSSAICFIAAWYIAAFVKLDYEDGAIAFLSVPSWACEIIMPITFTLLGLRFLGAAFSERETS